MTIVSLNLERSCRKQADLKPCEIKGLLGRIFSQYTFAGLLSLVQKVV